MIKHCCQDFEKAVNYDDFAYYRVEDDNYGAITKPGWYIHNAQYNRPIGA